MYKYDQEETGKRPEQSHYSYWSDRKDSATKYATLTPHQMEYYEERLRAAIEQDRLEAQQRHPTKEQQAPAPTANSDVFSDEKINRYAQKMVASANVCFQWLRGKDNDPYDEYLSRREFLQEQLRWITDVRKMLLRAMEVTE